jgi:tetratricopeptide (TPR) repeat protein
MKRMLMTLLAFLALSAAAYADATWCVCYCGKRIKAPCPNVDQQCQRECGDEKSNFKPGKMEEMPTVLPFNVQKYTAAKEAYDKGDYDTAFAEAQRAVNADRCYAPARALYGELFLRYGGQMCVSGGQPVLCELVGAVELSRAADGDPSCQRMYGMSPDEARRLSARAEPLYNAAREKQTRLDIKRDSADCEALTKQGAPGAKDKCEAVIQDFHFVPSTKEDWALMNAYNNLATVLESRGDVYGAIDAMEAALKTPTGVFYSPTPLGKTLEEKLDRLKRKAGYCEVVLNNNSYDTLDLYINDSNTSVCRALGRPRPPSDGSPAVTPPYPTFCTAHVREGTYTLSAKTPDGEFFTRASGPVWCPKGEVKSWNVGPR